LMTTEMDNTDKITKYIGDARAHQMQVLPPNVNFSQKRFSVERTKDNTKTIRFGLEAIKGVGGIAVDTILESRVSEGPFKNVLDFCRRVSTRKVNKKVLESLTLAGAFDDIAEVNRASLFASLETLLEHAGDEQHERELGQNSLFDSFGSDEVKLLTPATNIFKKEEDFPASKKLQLEKQVVGFYVSGHPMDTWQRICEEWLGWSTERIKLFAQEKAAQKKPAPAQDQGWGGEGGYGRYRAPKTEVKLGGLLGEFKEVMTKKGTRMAFAQLEDLKGKIEVIFFPDTYATVQEMVKKAVAETEPVVLHGEMEAGDEAIKVIVKTLDWATEAHKKRVQHVVLKLLASEVSPDQLRELKKNLLEHRGKCPVRIDFTGSADQGFRTSLELPRNLLVSATPQMVASVNRIFGRDVVSLK
jgi:DNA polymerase-3 subunit alpha